MDFLGNEILFHQGNNFNSEKLINFKKPSFYVSSALDLAKKAYFIFSAK